MFLEYFNFKEKPFNIAIDPAYLFLGRHHEEAIAHLTYAVSEGEGFIAITGEQGVGKTIICSSFIEQLDSTVVTAYIDRTTSNPEKLLKYINAKFHIRFDTKSVKELADALNEFLIQKKLEGKKVVVFIDDAHKLNRDVLEQVRLISNLETSREKLLQLVLIGEPQLSQMLDSTELRQIGQRVSVGYCIGPLTYDETIAYIHHRLTIASKGPPISFDQKAVQHFYKYSGGIPRNINMVCDRALQIAFKWKQKPISKDIAQAAISYLGDRAERAESEPRKKKPIGTIAAVSCILLVIAVAAYFLRFGGEQSSSKQVLTENAQPVPQSASQLPKVTASPSPESTQLPVMKKDIAAEPFPVDESRVDIESSDPFLENPGAGQGISPKMTYSVQVGAFRTKENAENLIAKLTAKGYSARLVEFSLPQRGTWYTVRIGDHATLQSAEKQARGFAERENMETVVRPYKQL